MSQKKKKGWSPQRWCFHARRACVLVQAAPPLEAVPAVQPVHTSEAAVPELA